MQVVIRAGVCDTDEAFAAFAKGAVSLPVALLVFRYTLKVQFVRQLAFYQIMLKYFRISVIAIYAAVPYN